MKGALVDERSRWTGGLPLVCVGGSAGGLDAYIRLLRHLPNDMNVAIVIVNHLRVVPTLLHEILPNHTSMPVDLIMEGMVVQPNHVFIIPAKRDLHVLEGKFRLKPISKAWDGRTSSLCAYALWPNTGTASSSPSSFPATMVMGRAAVGQIKAVGGITIAQKIAEIARDENWSSRHSARV